MVSGLPNCRCPDRYLLCLGIAALLIGATYYLLLRTDKPVFLAYLGIESVLPIPAVVMNSLGWLPTFIHAAAFTLLTAAWMPARLATCAYAALTWALINVTFESFQLSNSHAVIKSDAAIAVALNRFAVSGSFDWSDIVAAVAGALLGFWLCYRQKNRVRC